MPPRPTPRLTGPAGTVSRSQVIGGKTLGVPLDGNERGGPRLIRSGEQVTGYLASHARELAAHPDYRPPDDLSTAAARLVRGGPSPVDGLIVFQMYSEFAAGELTEAQARKASDAGLSLRSDLMNIIRDCAPLTEETVFHRWSPTQRAASSGQVIPIVQFLAAS